jgi:hypothetical protein
MPHVLGFKFETVNDEQRDAILNDLLDLFDQRMGIGEKVVLSYKVEGKTARGKQKVEHIVEWLRAEPAPTLEDLGISTTQNSMLALIDRYADERIERLNQIADAVERKRQEISHRAAEAEARIAEIKEFENQRDHEDELLDKFRQAADGTPPSSEDEDDSEAA